MFLPISICARPVDRIAFVQIPWWHKHFSSAGGGHIRGSVRVGGDPQGADTGLELFVAFESGEAHISAEQKSRSKLARWLVERHGSGGLFQPAWARWMTCLLTPYGSGCAPMASTGFCSEKRLHPCKPYARVWNSQG